MNFPHLDELNHQFEMLYELRETKVKSRSSTKMESSLMSPDINLIMHKVHHQGKNENTQRTNCRGNCLDTSEVKRCKTS